MRLSSLARLYRVRLRTRRVQELFAVVGIAVGVALLFAAQVASTSLDGSVQQLTSGLVGRMQFQLTARGPQGFPVSLLGEVQRIPGVLAAAPVLEERANAVGPSGQESVDLIGTDPRFADLGGPLLRHFHAYVLSHEVRAMKPAPLIYQRAIEEAGCLPEECFFTDDIPAYVEGARAQGIDAVKFESAAQIEAELRKRGVEW